jgi:hypothetical protein
MKLDTIDFVDGRLEQIAADLRKTNSEYALAVKMRKELWEKIDPIIMSKNQRTLLESDFLILQEYFQHEFTIAAIEQPTFYRQGYLDCVDLLQGLGIL